MPSAKRRNRRGFSLIELVIVVVIIGILSAIAIPRMIRGADGADVSALQSNLNVLRNAIELYRFEHGAYPDQVDIINQLTKRTDSDGTINAVAGAYGPYLVKMPPLPTGVHKDETPVAAAAANPPVAEVVGTFGWQYDQPTGEFWANDADHFDK